MKVSARNEVLIAAAIMVVLALAFIVLLIVPQFSALSSLDAQLSDAQQQMQSAQNLLSQRQSAKANAAVTQADLMKLQNQMPDNPELPSLIIGLQNAATEAGVDFMDLKPGQPDPRDGYSAVPMDLSVQGRWADVVEYLRLVSKLERQIRVSVVSIAPVASNTSGGTATGSSATVSTTDKDALKADFKIEAYVIGQASGSTATPGTSPTAKTANP